MSLQLLSLTPADLPAFKRDMQTAFQLGAEEGGCPGDEQILPESHIDRSLNTPGALAYKAVQDGRMVGGAIIVLDAHHRGHLDFLYVKHSVQSRGIGKFIWCEIERLHPDVTVWETCTPYFEKRNIHFYINVCGFHIVDFFNARHPDPNAPTSPEEPTPEGMEDDEMFGFRKEITR